MSNVDWTSLAKKRGETLFSGDGGGTYDGMEARVKSLEDRYEKVDSKLDGIRVDLAEIKGKLSTMPTTLQLLGFILAVLAIAGLARVFAP